LKLGAKVPGIPGSPGEHAVDVREEGVIGPATPPQVPRQHRS